jgi:hypothetical protein
VSALVTIEGNTVAGDTIRPSRTVARLPSESEIDALATAVRTAHEAGERCGREAIKHFQRCGEALIEAKAAVGHRRFGPLLKTAGVHPRQAQRYMLLARELPKLPAAKASRVSQLSLRDAIGELSRLSSRAAKLSAACLDRALGDARREPLKKAVTRAANAERYPTTAPMIVARAAANTVMPPPDPLPRHIELLVNMLTRTIGVYAESIPELTSQDALEALNEVYMTIQEDGLVREARSGE